VSSTAARDVIAFWGTVGEAGEMVPRRLSSLQIAAAMTTPEAVASPAPSSVLPAVVTESWVADPQPLMAPELAVAPQPSAAPAAAPAPPVPAPKPYAVAPARPKPVAAPVPIADPYEN
jgi:hypothetical protein